MADSQGGAKGTEAAAAERRLVVRRATGELAVFRAPEGLPRRKPKTVLEEDDYVAALEKIIERDFYPQLPQLRAQEEYLQALEANDFERLRDISRRYGTPGVGSTASSRRTTPSRAGGSFETPLPGARQDAASPWSRAGTPGMRSGSDLHLPGAEGGTDGADSVSAAGSNRKADDKPSADTTLSLDRFLDKYTSEDNDSFDQIIEQTNLRLRAQFESLFGRAEEQAQRLALTDGDKDAYKSYFLDHWRHTPRNQLMWAPSEKTPTAKELIALSKRKQNVIQHANTRFTRAPFPTTGSSNGTKTGTKTGASQHGVVILRDDGNKPSVHARHTPSSSTDGTPAVNGYKFVATPSPVPGQDLDPDLTWGEIDGTPFRLDAGDVPLQSGPAFNIPEPSARDQLGRRLAEDTAAKRRKMQHAAQARTRAGSVEHSSRHTPAARRLASMSPAAQQLARRLGTNRSSSSSLNSALRRATSSAGNRALGTRSTPRVTPRGTPSLRTPQGTPRADAKRQHSKDSGHEAAPASLPTDSTLTDNLL
ncbi:uncharacterized protein MONBRDRAFT_22377 [Monosiga brevicollis MX1]|uniref:Nuclear protein Es2 n=1 Tax=Monosiga brevicollis TaxID=81824 RepID=A9UQE4_MONBE|nr:uncharacterized protein MONBRDRAFT_22377 [Monosiga brevicollis MX1]EDQ92584.1 predicted protein [Monosiga brevicollis MX1]|eukprot:XP_001742346.1 hypothetical protein [Monosiga brevicollis MX1]